MAFQLNFEPEMCTFDASEHAVGHIASGNLSSFDLKLEYLSLACHTAGSNHGSTQIQISCLIYFPRFHCATVIQI